MGLPAGPKRGTAIIWFLYTELLVMRRRPVPHVTRLYIRSPYRQLKDLEIRNIRDVKMLSRRIGVTVRSCCTGLMQQQTAVSDVEEGTRWKAATQEIRDEASSLESRLSKSSLSADPQAGKGKPHSDAKSAIDGTSSHHHY
ncbi:hypothetical protein PCANC_01820 [Puccinia coronata f. sp. avenae]|uniref:Uncharacterized protein n=1 Tax=Puccinia coronata f. sp. avenae TaxID=200324 RepID=A0A2N5W554_9BASI|nr:hypothetical protein PCANC_01820 [Puccinia coronata f. sp. avenae]